jgi:hypothetical protein
MQLLVVLWWLEPETGGGRTLATSSIKLSSRSPDLGDFVLVPPRGGGDGEGLPDEAAVIGSA